jgi:hypothetical protein
MSIGHALLGTGDGDGCRLCTVVYGVRSTVGRRNDPDDTGKAGGNYGSFALCLRIMPGFVFRVKEASRSEHCVFVVSNQEWSVGGRNHVLRHVVCIGFWALFLSDLTNYLFD